MPDSIQIRRNTAAAAAASNPVLALGEPGYETDTGVLKIGDGITAWNDLPAITEGVVGTYIPHDMMPVSLGFALSDETSALTTGTMLAFRSPFEFTLSEIRASISTTSSSGPVTIDVSANGVSVFSTLLTIDAGSKTSLNALTPAVLSTTTITDDAEITFDIDTAGTGATGAKIWLMGTRDAT